MLVLQQLSLFLVVVVAVAVAVAVAAIEVIFRSCTRRMRYSDASAKFRRIQFHLWSGFEGKRKETGRE